jgi:hypothetical protein
LVREAKGQEQAEKTIECRGEGHGDAVRGRKTVGGNGGTESAREKNADMGAEQKGRPENCGADSEMVFEVARGRSKVGPGLVIFVEARASETFVGVLIVFGEIETMLNQRSASKSVVAHAIAAQPGV